MARHWTIVFQWEPRAEQPSLRSMRYRLPLLLIIALALLGGCARTNNSESVYRINYPTMTDDVGHQPRYSDGGYYMKFDP